MELRGLRPEADPTSSTPGPASRAGELDSLPSVLFWCGAEGGSLGEGRVAGILLAWLGAWEKVW